MDSDRSISTLLRHTLRRHLACFAGATALMLSACEDAGSQLEERVNQLHGELNRAQTELQDARRSLASAKEELAKAKGAGTLDKTQLEESYKTAVKEMREQVEARLKGFAIESCTLHNVRMPESVHPYTSEVSLALRSTDTRKAYQITLPVKADLTGKWSLPTSDEIAARIESSKDTATPRRMTTSGGDAIPRSGTTQVMPSNETRVIEWSSGASSPEPARPAPAATRSAPPTPNENPAAVMPVNQDVLIKF